MTTTETAAAPAPEPAAAPAPAPAPGPEPQLMFQGIKTGETLSGGNDTQPAGADTQPGGQETVEGGDSTTEGGENQGDDTSEGGEEKPIEYDALQIPDDQPAPEAVLNAFKEVGQKYKIPQDAMNELIGLQMQMNEHLTQSMIDTYKDWANELKGDQSLGGKNLDTTLNKANAIVARYGDETLVEDLQLLGLGNKLSFARFLTKIYDRVAEDGIGDTRGGGGETKKGHASILYPEMNP